MQTKTVKNNYMNSPKVISHAGLTLNLANVKCLKLSIFDTKNTITVEFKTRYDFIQHPKTRDYIKQEYNEKTEVEFPDYDSAIAYKEELQQIWSDYLTDQE